MNVQAILFKKVLTSGHSLEFLNDTEGYMALRLTLQDGVTNLEIPVTSTEANDLVILADLAHRSKIRSA